MTTPMTIRRLHKVFFDTNLNILAYVDDLLQEIEEFQKDASAMYSAGPVNDDMFEWHFTLRGPPGTEYDGGLYHGRISLPHNYPMAPPAIYFLTPNGRFQLNTKICLSMSSYHPESWQPAWTIRLMLEALISFLPSKGEGALGSLDWTPEERKKLATQSKDWKCSICGAIKDLVPVQPQQQDGSAAGNGSGATGASSSGGTVPSKYAAEIAKMKVFSMADKPKAEGDGNGDGRDADGGGRAAGDGVAGASLAHAAPATGSSSAESATDAAGNGNISQATIAASAVSASPDAKPRRLFDSSAGEGADGTAAFAQVADARRSGEGRRAHRHGRSHDHHRRRGSDSESASSSDYSTSSSSSSSSSHSSGYSDSDTSDSTGLDHESDEGTSRSSSSDSSAGSTTSSSSRRSETSETSSDSTDDDDVIAGPSNPALRQRARGVAALRVAGTAGGNAASSSAAAEAGTGAGAGTAAAVGAAAGRAHAQQQQQQPIARNADEIAQQQVQRAEHAAQRMHANAMQGQAANNFTPPRFDALLRHISNLLSMLLVLLVIRRLLGLQDGKVAGIGNLNGDGVGL